jgi:hypothetical protein
MLRPTIWPETLDRFRADFTPAIAASSPWSRSIPDPAPRLAATLDYMRQRLGEALAA